MESAFPPISYLHKLNTFKNEMMRDAKSAKDTFAASAGYNKGFSGRLEIENYYKL